MFVFFRFDEAEGERDSGTSSSASTASDGDDSSRESDAENLAGEDEVTCHFFGQINKGGAGAG